MFERSTQIYARLFQATDGPMCVNYVTQRRRPSPTIQYCIPSTTTHYLVIGRFLTTNQHPFSKPLFSHFSMTGQSVSFHLRTLFEFALEDYEIKTQISLAEHPLAQKLENCHSVESITSLLQDQARTFGEFRGRDRTMKSIRNTVSFLYKLSATTTLVDGISLVRQKTLMTVFHVSDFVLQLCPPAKALHTGLGVLLAVCLSSNPPWHIRSDTRVHQAAEGVVDSYSALVDFLEAIEHFLKVLDIYTEVPPTPAMDELVVKIMVELLFALALATKELKQERSSESILAAILYNSAQRRGIRTRKFWSRPACRSNPAEVRSAHA